MSERIGKRPHPLRLAAYMLSGAAFGALCTPALMGHGSQYEQQLIEQMLWIVGGAIAGMALELFVRVVKRD